MYACKDSSRYIDIDTLIHTYMYIYVYNGSQTCALRASSPALSEAASDLRSVESCSSRCEISPLSSFMLDESLATRSSLSRASSLRTCKRTQN